ncbi:MAG: enoyl-CoA hydratase/isomerase family protein [Legionellales bacterium]|nr:enoyl-CoA hydratase/isomerase family protein [Legionellales bacterium]
MTLLVEKITQQIISITLNRPEKSNAFNQELIREFNRQLTTIQQDDTLRAVILKANGKHFSAGADLVWMQTAKDYSLEENLSDAMELAELMKNLYLLNKPVIACVHGATLGGGVGLIASADIVLADPQASFCLSEVKLGLIPAVISPYVIAAIGERQARRYFITAEKFSCATAMQLGLVHESIHFENLFPEALRLANLISQNAPIAVKCAKSLVQRVSHRTIDEDLLRDTAMRIAKIRISNEGQEGLQAFLEKRQPNWIINND